MNETEEIKARLPIEEVIGGYITLKKTGRVYKACCPFHGEKTPSFTVTPDRGIFKCFGCGEGGDIFDFVMKLEGLSFPETLENLAARAGVTLPERSQSKNPDATPKQRLFDLNMYVSKIWHKVLETHPKAEFARTYLEGRGLQKETIREFQIGYAPFGSGTLAALEKTGFSKREISEAGDPSKFQDRIVFPIADITGKIIGFTGRLLELPDDPRSSSSRGPKYWNTPETAIFSKSRALYGLHLAKRSIQDRDSALLVEGQMDVVMLHQAGFKQTVASSGTALTTEQVKLLSRFTTSIIFAYDADKAGIEATKRGIELVLSADLTPLVIVSPNGSDPADCLKKNPDAWQEAYENRKPALAWLIDQYIGEIGSTTPAHKKTVVAKMTPWLEKVLSEVERKEWIRQLAARLQTEEGLIGQALGTPGVTSSPEKVRLSKPEQRNHSEIAAGLILAFPTIFSTVKDQINTLTVNEKTPFLERVLPILQSLPENLSESLKKSLSENEQKELSLYIEELLKPYREIETDDAWALAECMALLQRIRSESKEDQKTQLAREIYLAQQDGDTVTLQQLFSKLKDML